METHGQVRLDLDLLLNCSPSICLTLLLDTRSTSLEWDFCIPVTCCSPHLRTQRTDGGITACTAPSRSDEIALNNVAAARYHSEEHSFTPKRNSNTLRLQDRNALLMQGFLYMEFLYRNYSAQLERDIDNVSFSTCIYYYTSYSVICS